MIRILKSLLWLLLAFNLALVALTWILSAQAESEHPMQGKKIAAGNYSLHVIDSGTADNTDAPALVLIHGASTSAMDFTTQLQPRLAQHWRVLAFDRPGHGYSDRGPVDIATHPAQQAAMILDALETMNVNKAVFIGHSWAGSVVMASLLASHPQVNVVAGVLIAGATHPWDGDSAWHVELSAKPVIGDIFRWQYVSPIGRVSLQDAIAGVFSPEKIPDNYIEDTAIKLSLRPATYKHNALDLTNLSEHLELQATNYTAIKQPLLSIAGAEDTVVPAWNHHDRLLVQVPDIQGVLVEGSGHAPHHTQPDIVMGAIEAFLSTL